MIRWLIITILGCSSNESGKHRDTTEDINLTCLKIDSGGPQDPWAKFSGDLDRDGTAEIIIGGRRIWTS
jgi:hypothetical protein